jgi:ubiquinone/menaquinone biosynthesis C-methylase UbiE
VFRRSGATLSKYQRIAAIYDLIDLPFEYFRYRSIRPMLFLGLNGRLLDAGAGTGRNIAFYPSGSEVFAVDLSPAMLKRAGRRRSDTNATVHLMEEDLTKLGFTDNFFDAAVASFVFCTMPSGVRKAALRELARVVSPGGAVRLLEYAPATTSLKRVLARAWQPWAGWAFGAKLAQDIEPELYDAGLMVTSSRYITSSIKLIETTPILDGGTRAIRLNGDSY